MIEAVHLCKRYGAQTAVEDIHFSVSPGEIVGLIGHNGSGKTTTMRMLTGCLEPTSGDVLIDGQSLLRHAELKKQIGYLPEIPPLYPEMTVNEQMCFAAGLRGLTGKAAKDAITTALRQLHVEEVRRRLIRNLSKGYRQRVGFAQAIIGAPMLLVLDEPTVGLDPSQIIEVRQIISELSSTHTILLSSHIVTDLEKICDYVVFLHKGRVQMAGEKDELLERYALLNMTHEDYAAMEKRGVARMLEGHGGVRVLMERQAAPRGAQTERLGLEDMMLLLEKGEKA